MEHRYLHMRRDFLTWGEGGVLTVPPNLQYQNEKQVVANQWAHQDILNVEMLLAGSGSLIFHLGTENR